MRRKDREITDLNKIAAIMKKCDVCSLAFFDDEYPYIVPLNFGMNLVEDKITLYFHGANAGKKLELIKKNNKVGFEMNCSHKLLLGEKACNSTMEYESVCGNGIIEILKEAEKREALTYIMKQYNDKEEYEFDRKSVDAVVIFRLIVSEVHGKILKKQ
ncbi:pyridoxamine 5'-phosphate oxidase family protein [Clostridium neuense]|uniref:Pyridoxamine 5'-phosphate oxidase family protein n=1 Tax=Clostridium neuense TaxID=1728934 RepID=A0ABW8TE57_9CLOT